MTDPSAAAPSCVCLTGPTASGKTDVALALAEQFPIEIISMDSALVYRGLDIGTAKPPSAVRERVPHHLIDIVDPSDPYSAGRFVEDAARIVDDIAARDRIPLLVGGTMLYLRAFRDGLAPLPAADPALRARLDREGESLGWPSLHARLAEIDPTTASRLAASDRQRIQRALEVFELTGETISALQQSEAAGELRPTVNVLALVDDDRDALARRIERRFDAMVEAGFVAEVERLRDRGDLSPDLPALRAVGYRQIWQYLDGAFDWDQTRASALAATRQLAKRQMTWLRSETNFATVAWSDSRCAELARQWLSDSISG